MAKIENRLVGAGTIYLGTLTGGPNTKLLGTDQASNPGAIDLYVIGGLNLDSTFAGSINDTGHKVAITKTGAGIWTLSGTNNYSGLTTVAAGTLQVSGSLTTTNFLIVSNTATVDLSGTVTANTVQINAGGTLTGCGTINGNLLNNGTVLADCGAPGGLTISGNVTNNGVMQIVSGTALAVNGMFVNNGLLDLLSGAQNLPVNFVNNGSVLLATNIVINSFSQAGGTLSLTIQGFDGHTYQLQRTASLPPANWQNVGPSQDGVGAPLTFTDTPNGSQNFYRVLVAP
jgi:autotransporter-associated beta strand protein